MALLRPPLVAVAAAVGFLSIAVSPAVPANGSAGGPVGEPRRPDVAAQTGGTGGAIPTPGQIEGTATGGRPMGPVDVLEVESVGSPVLSPDGERILFTRTWADWEQDRTVSHIWHVRIDGSDLRLMTNGPGSESGATWAPDGRSFAFLAGRGEEDDDAGRQIWTMPIDGGEARQLTDHPTSVGSIEWAPDGSTLYFLAEEPKSEEEKALEKRSGEAVVYPRNWKHRQLWKVAVPDDLRGVVEPVEAERVTHGDRSVWSFELSPDGSRIVLVQGPTPLLDELDQLDLWLLDPATGESRRLTDTPGVPEGGPRISPDNRWVAYTADANAEGDFYYESNLFLLPLDDTGGSTDDPGASSLAAPRLLLEEMAGEVEGFDWGKDAGSLIAQINLGVHSELFRVELGAGNGQATAVPLTGSRDDAPAGTIERFDHVPGRGLVFLREAPDNPGDLWYAVAMPFDARRVTDLHAELRSTFALPRAEVVRWTSTDGSTVEGILWYPIDYQEGINYPLVVQIHGGPASSVQLGLPTWTSTYTPVLTGMGYMVLQPNYRGGVGYGDEFLRDMVGEYFRHADDDVYTGVDALIERGLADPDRTAIMGWSAGGHMTNWVVTQTDRFAAAASGAGASNWTSMYAQSDVRIYRTPWFGGTPWQADAPLQAYLRNSPAFYAHQASTPTLILVGEKDERVPAAQSIEMYRALKHSGVETKLVTFPEQPHGLRRLKHRLHKINVELEWFERHVRGRDYKYVVPPGEDDDESSHSDALP